MENINFFAEDIEFNLRQKSKIRSWLKSILRQNNRTISSINYIFTSDKYLLQVNKEYLNHSTLTDIITFDQSLNAGRIESDIYISIDRVKENSINLQISFEDELHRVMVHGILHLLGYTDKNDVEKEEMREKENHYLTLRF